jgi:hypothetical protein
VRSCRPGASAAVGRHEGARVTPRCAAFSRHAAAASFCLLSPPLSPLTAPPAARLPRQIVDKINAKIAKKEVRRATAPASRAGGHG